MDRRSFVTGLAVGGAVGAGAASLLTKPKEVIKEVEVVKEVAAPAIAAERVEIAMVATWGRDFPGLLHQITKSLADLGLQIQTATVSTYGERVVDVFYVKDIFGLQIQNGVRQQTIRNRLLEIFVDTDEAMV